MSSTENIDVSSLTDRLQRYLMSGTEGHEAAFAADMKSYSDVCGAVNLRLRECFDLSAKGRYANAIELSEREPNLLEQCSALAFSGHEALKDAAVVTGVPEPELMNRMLFEALDETCRKWGSAERDTILLRKLTLQRAPLPTRLAIMRRLSVRDPNHPFLEKDIRQFEVAWYRKAVNFCREYADSGNAAVIQEVLDDLRNGGYLETPPKQVVMSLQALLVKAQQVRQPQLAEEIHAAWQERSQIRLCSLVGEWHALCKLCDLDPEDPQYGLKEALAVVRRFHDSEKQKQAIADVKQTLSRRLSEPQVTRPILEQAYASARSFNALDSSLESRYQQKIRQFDRAVLVRKSVIGTALGVFLLIGGTVAYSVISAASRASAISGLKSEMEGLISSKQFEDAIKKFQESSSSVQSNEDVKKLEVMARNAVGRSKAIQEIQDCPISEDVSPLVTKAKQFADTDADHAEIKVAESEWTDRREKHIAATKAKLDDEARALSTKIAAAELDTLLHWNPDALEAIVREARSKMENIKTLASSPGVNAPSFVSEENRTAALEAKLAMAMEMKDLINSTTDVGLSRQQLQSLATLLQKQRRGQSLASDGAIWMSVFDLTQSLAAATSNSSNVSGWSQPPLRDVISQAELEFSRRSQRRPKGMNSSSIILRLDGADITNLFSIKAGAYSHPFYSRTQVQKDGPNLVAFDAIVDEKGNTLEKRLVIKSIEPAPQSDFAVFVKAVLENSTESTWHSDMVKIYTELRSERGTGKGIDPILRFELMDKTLSTCSQYSKSFRELFDRNSDFGRIIGKSVVYAGFWQMPPMQEGKQADDLERNRMLAKERCESAPDLKSTDGEAARKSDEALVELAKSCVAIIGLIDCSESTLRVKTFPSKATQRSGTVYVVADGTWKDIGRCDSKGAVSLNDTALEFVGYPVILISPL